MQFRDILGTNANANRIVSLLGKSQTFSSRFVSLSRRLLHSPSHIMPRGWVGNGHFTAPYPPTSMMRWEVFDSYFSILLMPDRIRNVGLYT